MRLKSLQYIGKYKSKRVDIYPVILVSTDKLSHENCPIYLFTYPRTKFRYLFVFDIKIHPY